MSQLTVENGVQKGTVVSLSRDQVCTVGSHPDCDLVLDAPGIAERHAVIKALKGEGFGVKALDADVDVNGAGIEASPLRDGDTIELAGIVLRFSASARGASGGKRITVAGFRIAEVLGAGGMGTVYRAEQVSLNREVALKVLSKKLTKDPVFVARFVAEARAAARLSHPNVVQVFDVGHDGDTYYFSMELMSGSLEDRLKQGPLPPEEALAVIGDAARGLAYAESLRLVHRDIKPDNLMVDAHGSVKIADLGLAMTDEDDNSKVVGTPHFMSPEQALRRPLDHRSDLYSLGCTLYRLLSGRTPFRRSSVKEILVAHVKETPEPLTDLAPAGGPEAAAMVERLMQKDPDARYQSAEELVQDIEAALAPPSRRGMWIAAITAAVLLAGGGLAWGLTRPEGKTVREVVQEKDPRVAGLLERIRQMEGELARRQALLDTTGGSAEARAAALDVVAKDHADTDAAAAASKDAARIRAEERRREAARLAHDEAVRAAADGVRKAVDGALDEGDYTAALATLELAVVPAELRSEDAVQAARDEAAARVRRHAAARLAQLRGAVTSALDARDADAMAPAIDAIAAVVAADGGWPAGVFQDRAELEQWTTEQREALSELQLSLRADVENAAWERFATAVLADDGLLADVDALALDDAEQGARALADELGEFSLGERAGAMAQSLQRADAFVTRFAQAAESSLLEAPAEGDAEREVVGFVAQGDEAGLKLREVRSLRRTLDTIPLAELRGTALARSFRIPTDKPTVADRAAFLGWLSIADLRAAAARYLTAIDPNDASSGTGDGAFPHDDGAIVAALDALRPHQEPWAMHLRREVRAAHLLVRALRDFAGHRNRSAANLIDELKRDHARSLMAAAF